MWLKENRFLLVSKIYQILFWKEFSSNLKDELILDFPIIDELVYPDDWMKFVSEKVLKLEETEINFQKFLASKLHKSDKTFLLVKAILASAYLEINEIGLQSAKELKLANVYGKLTQELVGGQSPELVFSILNSLE
jgi:hypothetical protein